MWLLESSAFSALEAIRERNIDVKAMSGFDRHQQVDPVVIKGVAVIQVQGVLTKEPDFFAMLFGGGNTTYASLTEQINAAMGDDDVDSIRLDIDSPGGQVSGLFQFLDVLKAATKPIAAVVGDMACSAAYAIAASADTIEATGPASSIGCIGVVVSSYVDENVVTLTSTEAPDKAPDVSTEEGKKVVVKHLDGLHALFVDAIAEGRGVSTEVVNANYGRGGVLLAEEALSQGMIDCIVKGECNIGSSSTTETKMDLNELKTKHSDIYMAACKEGADTERKRVSAHLVLGEASGAMDIAIKAVKEGSDHDALSNAEYAAAGMRTKEIAARKEDDTAGDTGTQADASAENTVSAQESLEKSVLALMGDK